MATPKGMRAVQIPVSESDAIHVYSDPQHIWIQLRRKIPTERDIGSPSFKTAFCLTPSIAHKLGYELLKLAEANKGKPKAKTAVPPNGPAKKAPPKAKTPLTSEKTKPSKLNPQTNAAKLGPRDSNTKAPQNNAALCPRCRTTETVEHDGRQWCPLCGAFTTARNSHSLPRTKTPAPAKKPIVLDLISDSPNLRNISGR